MDIIDQADEAIEQHREQALQRLRAATAEHETQLIDGSRGAAVVLCRDCLAPIAPERLAVRPYAVRCVSCQTDLEQQSAAEDRAYGT
jgi:phage/conjugal plasmid C-4 type zinc finger TraR family protein